MLDVRRLLLRWGVILTIGAMAWYCLGPARSLDSAAPERSLAKGRFVQRTPHPTWTPRPTWTPLPTATSTPLSSPQPTDAPSLPADLRELVVRNGFDPAGRFLVVDQDNQRMIVADHGAIVRELPISTGDPDRNAGTPAWIGRVGAYWGTFTADGVSADDAWFLFKDAGSILIHGAPYVIVDGVKQYQELHVLGAFPASRGCIRLRPEDAAWLTGWGPYDVPIIILPWTRPPAQG